jgi:hypothetical protein
MKGQQQPRPTVNNNNNYRQPYTTNHAGRPGKRSENPYDDLTDAQPPSRLRAPTKTAAPARGIPAPKPRPLGAATTVEAGVKRKAPGDAPPAKRVASGSGSRPAPAAAAHTMARRSATAAPVPAPAARKAAVPPRPATATGRRPAAPAPAPPPARGPSRAGVRPGAPPSNGDILSFLQEE